MKTEAKETTMKRETHSAHTAHAEKAHVHEKHEAGEAKNAAKAEHSHKNIAAVLVRGLLRTDIRIKDTLKMLNLNYVNNCIVLKATPSNMGMIKKAKDYITYGEIDEHTLNMLTEKRGKEGQKIFRLNPPKKGYGRKGTKKAFSVSGALGYRGEKINDLIKRMI